MNASQMLPIDEPDELDERDLDEPLQDEADSPALDEIELPPELIGVPFN